MIDWQLQLTFDNFLRFFYIQTQLFYLILSTTVCFSACISYKSLLDEVTLAAVFNHYMYWLKYSDSHLHILVSFYPLMLCLYVFCIFPLQVLQRFSSSISGIFYSNVEDILSQIFCVSLVSILFAIHMYCTHSRYLLVFLL